jgi:hypothetical protein
MKKRYSSLNEEINRIKSLFSEERLYGNLKQSNLLIEQGIGRKLSDALDTANSSISKAIKNIDPKLATNFLNAEINTFDDLAKHLNDYKSLWRSMGIDWDYANDAILSFKKWSDTGFLKTADDKLILQVINDLPPQGDLRGMVFDLWKESKGKYTPPKTKSQTTIVTKSKTGENVIQKVETVGGKEKIETFKIENDGIKKDDTYDPIRASEEVNAYYEGLDLDSNGGTSRITTDEINANGNPDNIKGEIISAIEEGFNKISGKGGKEMGVDQIVKEIENGKVLMIKQADGSYRVINTIELIEMTVDEFGVITNVKSIGKKDVTPPDNVPPVKDGGESVDVSTDGGRNLSNKSKNNFSSSIGNTIGQGFRYIFPTVSEILKRISLLGPGRKFYSKPRFSIVDNKLPVTGDFSASRNLGLKNFIENPVRVILVEQAALITIVAVSKSIQRGELPKDESALETALADYWSTKIWKYYPIYWLPNVLVWAYEDVSDLRKGGYASCRAKAEKTMKPEEVTNNEEFKKCKAEVDAFFKKFDDFRDDFKEFKKEYVDLMNIKEWDQAKIEKFCEEDLVKKQEKLKKMRESLTNLDDELKNRFEKSDLKDRQYIVPIVDALRTVLPVLPELPTYEEITGEILPKSEIGGKKLTPMDIQELENKLNAACAEYWNKKRDIQDEIVDPDDDEEPIDTLNIDPEVERNIEDMFGSVEVVVEPIEIV